MSNAPNTTENVTIHLKVKDYATWRTSSNGHEKDRATAGITNCRWGNQNSIDSRERVR